MRLAPVFLGSLARRRMATLFSFVAIVLGVALGMAVQAVHEAALTEFGRGLRTLAGDADLQVVGPRGGFDESLYAQFASRPEVAAASPLLELEARHAGTEETLQLLGVDVFALARVTPRLLPRPAAGAGRFATLADDSIFLSAAAQEALGLKTGDRITLQSGSGTTDLKVAGDLPGAAENRRLAVMDIAAVQSLFARIGRLTRIDLQLAEGVAPDAARSALQAILPAGVLIEAPEAAADQAANLSRAYRVNLTMLAAMALLTGGFLVFSAQALSVVRRRTEFAFLRALGLPRRSLFAWLVTEGALVGLAGGLVGVALGHGLAWGMLALLGGDLGAGYFSGLQPRLQFQPGVTALYVALGVLAGVAGAWLPAREAATVSPAQALKAGDEAALLGGRGHPWLGLTLLPASLAACWIPPLDGLPLGGYLAVAFLLAGSVMLLPAVASGIAWLLPQRGPVPARLAAARLGAAPGHAVVAAAGVLTSVALAAAMAIMVASFRDSVDQWLTQILPADLYLRAGQAKTSAYLDEALQARISSVNGVDRSSFTRHDNLRLAAGEAPVALIARPLAADGSDLPLVGRRTAWKGNGDLDLRSDAGHLRLARRPAGHAAAGRQGGQCARRRGLARLFAADRRRHDRPRRLPPPDRRPPGQRRGDLPRSRRRRRPGGRCADRAGRPRRAGNCLPGRDPGDQPAHFRPDLRRHLPARSRRRRHRAGRGRGQLCRPGSGAPARVRHAPPPRPDPPPDRLDARPGRRAGRRRRRPRRAACRRRPSASS